MDFSKATILVTGGNSGIGRGLAEAFMARGATIVVTGRDPRSLQATLDANPGMSGIQLDLVDAGNLSRFAEELIGRHSQLNAIVHNAGVRFLEHFPQRPFNLPEVEQMVTTNLLGPIRLTAALLPQLLSQPEAAIVTVTSGLAFVPRTDAATYSATKAALHSWTQSLRHRLRDTAISVTEIAPPLVETKLTAGQIQNRAAVTLDGFVEEAVGLLFQQPTPDEVVVERVMPQRNAERSGRFDEIFKKINPAVRM